MKQQNKLDHIYNTLIVPQCIEYEAAKIIGVKPSKDAMKNYIKRLEKELEKIKNRFFYKVLNILNLL